MPAAAVIPAPIAYIKVVAVKTSVVEFLGETIKGKGQLSGCNDSFIGTFKKISGLWA